MTVSVPSMCAKFDGEMGELTMWIVGGNVSG